MYRLVRTQARADFKDLLGQANHFLITIMVGLNGVRKGSAILDEEFRTSWNPRDIVRSAERSRAFALDLALVRAIDSFDTYMMLSRREPRSIESASFASAMDGTGRKVSKRLEVFNQHLPPIKSVYFSFLRLAIDWRNRRVHSLAEDEVDDGDLNVLLSSRELLHDEFSGLDIVNLIDYYRKNKSPTFKDAASIIKLVHHSVSHFDARLLAQIDLDRYLTSMISQSLAQNTKGADKMSFNVTCNKIWGHNSKRRDKIIRLLRLSGVSESSSEKGREVSDRFIESLVELTPGEASSLLYRRR